jgi:cullin 1
MESFTSFYDHKHNGRKLTWLWQLCKGEIKANYIKNQKVPYTFQVSTYQMAILLLFNDAEKLDYQDIKEMTSLTDENLEPAMGILCKARVVTPQPEDGKAEAGTKYLLNHNFKNKKVKINLNIQVKSEQKVEADETHKTIEEDRKLLLQVSQVYNLPLSSVLTRSQAVIVRIMKGRKKLKHVHLVEEVINQVRARFPPKIADIKKNIDALMEKDYIERLDNDELSYIA